jgi:hypothetical protein
VISTHNGKDLVLTVTSNDEANASPDVKQDGSAASSADQTQTKAVPVENRLAELTRKTDKKFTSLESKMDQLINFMSEVQQGTSGARADNAASNYSSSSYDEMDPVAVARAEVATLRTEMLKKEQAASYKEACVLFPELDQASENFDEDFFKQVDSEFRKLSSLKDPQAPLKAAKYIALEQGKMDQLARSRVLQDDSRRSRLLEEGGSQGNHSAKKQASDELPKNLSTLAGLLKVDTDGLKKHIKANPSRYGMK